MPSDLRLLVIESPPAPPPPGFFPEDVSLYKRPPVCAPDSGVDVASPGAVRCHTKRTMEELIPTCESGMLRACAPQMLPSELPVTNETPLLAWYRALVEKRRIETQLADVQLDCEMLERDVMDRFGEEAVKKTLNTVYNIGDTPGAKGSFMLSISNITYKSVEVGLGS